MANDAKPNDAEVMQLAVEIAKKCVPEDARPHPKVAAVLVKDGKLLEKAYRGEKSPGAHAEYTLFEEKLAGVDLKGTTLYTTLEPCTARQSHKPCCDWILEKKISRVVIGMLDPDPRIYGTSANRLREKGIVVEYFPDSLRKMIERDNEVFIGQFHASPASNGNARFNYSDNDGMFTIGSGNWLFETKWTKANDTSIYLYDDPPGIDGIAVAVDAKSLADLVDVSVYDMSSRVRTAKEGQFVVLRNTNDYFAVIHVTDVKDSDRSDPCDQLTFDYWIETNKGRNFALIDVART